MICTRRDEAPPQLTSGCRRSQSRCELTRAGLCTRYGRWGALSGTRTVAARVGVRSVQRCSTAGERVCPARVVGPEPSRVGMSGASACCGCAARVSCADAAAFAYASTAVARAAGGTARTRA
eukprot:6175708-Pleurochrysis_carterae.AAC.3